MVRVEFLHFFGRTVSHEETEALCMSWWLGDGKQRQEKIDTVVFPVMALA